MKKKENTSKQKKLLDSDDSSSRSSVSASENEEAVISSIKIKASISRSNKKSGSSKSSSSSTYLYQTPEKASLRKAKKSPEDSSDEESYNKQIEEYNELAQLNKIKKDKGAVNELSFISHALALEFFYSKKVQKSYHHQKRIHLRDRNHTVNNIINLRSFSTLRGDLDDISSLASIEINNSSSSSSSFSSNNVNHESRIGLAAATRFINRNAKRITQDPTELTEGSLSSSGKKFSTTANYNYHETRIEFTREIISLSEHLFYIKEKKSRLDINKKTHTRGHKVVTNISGGEAYENIKNYIKTISSSGLIIRELSQGIFINLLSIKSKTTQEKLVALTDLLFSCETSKNPAAYIHHQMLLDLVIDHGITWDEAIINLMPMSPSKAIMNARALNQLYEDYMPIKYYYDYVEATDGDAKVLALREENLVKKWLEAKHPTLDHNSIKDVIKIIKQAIKAWYNIDTNNLWYTEDQINELLHNYLSNETLYYTSAQTQFEHKDLLRDNLQEAINRVITNVQTAVMPINLHDNHWVAAIIRMQQDQTIQVIYIDPLGNTIQSEENAELFVKIITEINSSANILELEGLSQQNNEHDCGPFTVDNLIRLAMARNSLDGLNANEIIGLLYQNVEGNANEIRQEHNQILNLNSATPIPPAAAEDGSYTYDLPLMPIPTSIPTEIPSSYPTSVPSSIVDSCILDDSQVNFTTNLEENSFIGLSLIFAFTTLNS